MGKREYFPAYFSYRRTLKLLSDTQLGRVFMAALIYAEEGIEPDLEPLEMMGFGFIKEDIDRANENYEELCEKRKASGSKGGLAKANNSKSHKEKQIEEDEIFATKNLAIAKAILYTRLTARVTKQIQFLTSRSRSISILSALP